jgi:hypothetical protein
MSNRRRSLAIIGGLTVATFVVTQLIVLPARWVEVAYSRGLYRWIDALIRSLSNRVGFSLTEFALIALMALGVWGLIARLRRRRTWRSAALRLVGALAVLYIWFYFAWGFNYYRLPLVQQLGIENGSAPTEAFVELGQAFMVRANVLRPDSSMALSRSAIEADIDRTYPKVLRELGLAAPPPPTRVKRMILLNGLLNKTLTSGFFSPFFHEVHINADLLTPELPFVIAHERAHQLGYASEAEASFLAHLVCVRANLPISQYSGYFRVLGSVLRAIPDVEARRAIWDSASPGVRDDYAAVRAWYLKRAGMISRLSERGYDAYLKGNRIREGVQNYGRVVDLLALYYIRRDTLQLGQSRNE